MFNGLRAASRHKHHIPAAMERCRPALTLPIGAIAIMLLASGVGTGDIEQTSVGDQKRRKDQGRWRLRDVIC
jgi:hypothetical protein